ncbi:MAG: glycerol-3-phosphate 1-O-acyltransferase PlsY [Clostridia bacterium]|nr:glycerol-3-phosphate 1-O-acyltransferase PlsY [Clostridia bacterium]
MEELLRIGLIGKLGFEWGNPVFFLAMVFCVVAPYLLGSISFAVVFSKFMHHDDVREHGSGNAGSTNMLRTYGLKAALFTFLCDFLKGVIATLLGFLIMPYYTGFAYISALMCMVGHAFPIYYGFKGGKCVATFAGALLVLNPLVWILLLLTFVLIVYISRYVSLGSVICAAAFPLLSNMMPFITVTTENGTVAAVPPAGIIAAVLMGVLIIVLHRANIVRLWQGKESKISFKKKKS